MNLFHLPWSLLCASLAFAAAAAPVAVQAHNLLLTPENFTQTIADGVWLVEHFSPYCHHCRAFAPTWDLLVVDNARVADSGIHLAQVDCAVHGDLCDENKITSYPQINLYNDGKLVELYRGERSFEGIKEYMAKHARVTAPNRSPHLVATSSSDINPSGTVVSLDSDSFDVALRKGPVFVKFYAPWCGHCQRLAPTWSQLALRMRHKLAIAQVNCDDNSNLCKSQSIMGYPTLIYFFDGSKSEYTGGRDINQLMSFAEKASAPSVQELAADEALVSELEHNSVVYLILQQSHNDQIMNDLIKASKILFGAPPIFSSTSKALFSRYNLPPSCSWAILAFKDRDSSQPTAQFLDNSVQAVDHTQEALKKWMLENRLPTTVELTQDTFQDVMRASHQPLVVIAAITAESRDRVADKFNDIGKIWRRRGQGNGSTRDVVFAWMDADKWGSWLKSMYGIESGPGSDPTVVITDHAQLVYYDTDQTGQLIRLTSTSILSAIDGVSNGRLRPKHSENIVERGARYLNDMLSSMETLIIANFWRTVLVFGFLIVLVVVFLTRCVRSDLHERSHRNPKLSRLD